MEFDRTLSNERGHSPNHGAPRMTNAGSRVDLMGVTVDSLTVQELHDRILRACRSKSRALVLNVNAHAYNLAASEPSFRGALNAGDVVFCDGAGVRLAAWLAGHHIPERITYADWMWDFAEFSAQHGLTWFLLGGQAGRAEAASTALVSRVPNLQIVGTHHGYFDKALDSDENRAVVDVVNASNADVLIVGFGMPVQERWLQENWSGLTARVGLAGGAVFDYISGALRRPPWLLRQIGMEWFGRLLIEPRRLGRRYLIGNPAFLMRALVFALRSRVRRG